MRFWTDDISDVLIFEKLLNCLSITVFDAFSMSAMLQPFFFVEDGRPVTVNGERYRSMILTHLVPQLKHRRKFRRAIFMQDAAPSHTANETKALLRPQFSEKRLIGKGFEIAWSPYSPDLTPCDFWLWNEIKTCVYDNNNHTLAVSIKDLKSKIKNAFSKISTNSIQQVKTSILLRMNRCVELDGGHLEHILHK